MTANDVAKYLDDILDGPLAAPVKYINRVRDRIVELRDRMREVPPGELVTDPPDWLLKAFKAEMQAKEMLWWANQRIESLQDQVEAAHEWSETKQKAVHGTLVQLNQEIATLRLENDLLQHQLDSLKT
jgi:hypothetical protein